MVVVPESSWDTRRRKKRQIFDIATWVEVFSTYTLVLSSRFPESLPNLVSYQLTIVKLSKRFRYPSWLYYDVEYRKWASANHIRDWSQTNSELFALAFTGQAVSLSWCPVCQVEGDHTYDCPRYVATQAATTSRSLDQQAPRRQLPSLMDPPPAKRPPLAHCILYNKNAGACPYGSACRFQHICSHCFNPHPVTSCTNKATPPCMNASQARSPLVTIDLQFLSFCAAHLIIYYSAC